VVIILTKLLNYTPEELSKLEAKNAVYRGVGMEESAALSQPE
jgi:hypothetical protein